VMANMGGLSEQSAEDEEEELRQAFRVSYSVEQFTITSTVT
jgi:hypothetical protein